MLRPTQTREVEKCSRYYVNKAKGKHKMASGRQSTFPRLKQSSRKWNFSHGPSVNV